MTATAEFSLLSGFDNNVLDTTDIFRTVLKAMSRPATVLPLTVLPQAPEGLNAGSMAVLLTLADMDTPIWLAPECDTGAARANLQFHSGCPIAATPSTAVFAVITQDTVLDDLDDLQRGTAEYPDRSATVIVECDKLSSGVGPLFSGPGIEKTHRFDTIPASHSLWAQIAANKDLFPLGLDWIFISPTHLAALPRTTNVEF